MLPSFFSSPERRQRKNKHFSSAVPREKIGKCKRWGKNFCTNHATFSGCSLKYITPSDWAAIHFNLCKICFAQKSTHPASNIWRLELLITKYEINEKYSEKQTAAFVFSVFENQNQSLQQRFKWAPKPFGSHFHLRTGGATRLHRNTELTKPPTKLRSTKRNELHQ